jgi:LPS-assembly lipoprotein
MSLPTKTASCSTKGPTRRTVLRAGAGKMLLAAATPLLAACGFKPMYGGQHGGAVVSALAQVEVARIDDRIGQMLRNALERRLERSGGGGKAAKQYVLTCEVAETIDELDLSKDSFASRADLTLTVQFVLTAQGKILLSGTTQGIVAYNILDQQYGTVASEKNSRERAAEQAAEDITRRLSSYFSRNVSGG